MVSRIKRLIVLGAVLAATEAPARTPEFDPALEHLGARMTLRGVSILRVGYVFRVYWAALHVGEEAPTETVLEDVPKRLEIHYLRRIAASDLIQAGNEALRRQVPPDQLVRLQARIDSINRLYRDVQPGDRYTLTYVPGHGSELALNGTLLGRVEGADFASAYFGIWLDPRTEYREFHAGLMGRARAR